VIIFNYVGHHLRTLSGAFHSYATLVSEALAQVERYSKPSASLVMRTSNVGHAKCASEAQPLSSRADAWRRLGGWAWRPTAVTPRYYGAPRGGADRYDWRAPPLHEHAWAQQAASSPSLKGRFTVLNVSHVDLRSDGHVGDAMRFRAEQKRQGASSSVSDCLHYCIPGPADAWASALYNLLLNREEQERVGPRPAGAGPGGARDGSGEAEAHGGQAELQEAGRRTRRRRGGPRRQI
jgi:hypothetical protein